MLKYVIVTITPALIMINISNNWIFFKDKPLEPFEPAAKQLQNLEETPVQQKMIVDVEDGLNEPPEAVKSKVSKKNKFHFQGYIIWF